MSNITIIVGNIGTVLETTDATEASDVYRHYCDASDRGEGRMARETVTMLSDDEPVAEHTGYDARLESMDDGAFMPSFITEKTSWYSVESSDGTTFIQLSDVGDLPGLTVVGDTVSSPDDSTEPYACRWITIRDALCDFVDGTIESIEFITGHGARLSAPGYMDCTEYTIHDTEHDAIVYLVDTYANES